MEIKLGRSSSFSTYFFENLQLSTFYSTITLLFFFSIVYNRYYSETSPFTFRSLQNSNNFSLLILRITLELDLFTILFFLRYFTRSILISTTFYPTCFFYCEIKRAVYIKNDFRPIYLVFSKASLYN